MYMSVWNHPLLDLMSIDAAQSIEVFKGPQPQQFGNAFSAINLVPKKAKRGRIRYSVEAGRGQLFRPDQHC
jgi:iron complex outermembrane receptor protein